LEAWILLGILDASILSTVILATNSYNVSTPYIIDFKAKYLDYSIYSIKRERRICKSSKEGILLIGLIDGFSYFEEID